jgi:hypothetical protein
MALDKKGGFGLDLESQFKNAPRVTEVEPVDTHTHTDTHTAIEQEGKTKRTYGLVTPSLYKKITDYAKANNTSYNAIVFDLLTEFAREKGL